VPSLALVEAARAQKSKRPLLPGKGRLRVSDGFLQRRILTAAARSTDAGGRARPASHEDKTDDCDYQKTEESCMGGK